MPLKCFTVEVKIAIWSSSSFIVLPRVSFDKRDGFTLIFCLFSHCVLDNCDPR